MIRQIIIKEISLCFHRSFEVYDEILLTIWITDNLHFLEQKINYQLSKDEIFDNFADENTKNFKKLVKEIISHKEAQKSICRINILYKLDGYYVSLNELGKNTDINISDEIRKNISVIENKEKMDKGIFYENFCSLFLEDLGLYSEVTKASGDKGIDIKARYKTKLDKELSHLIFDDHIYLLAQAKFFNKSVDVPVLSKLLGDSILLRFDEFDYLDIAHNAFHLLVFSHKGFSKTALAYAKRKKIMTMDSEQIISIIASSKNPKTWKSYKYLHDEAN
jgi:hypothetical protein